MLSTIPCIYGAVLMDLRMPIMDGITATRFRIVAFSLRPFFKELNS